jgi:hypothetical protein
MNRREYLGCASTGLVGGLGGCLFQSNSESNSQSMRLSLVGVDDGPEPLIFSVTVVKDLLTSSTVPLLDISVENTGDEQIAWLYLIGTGVFPCGMSDQLAIDKESVITDVLVEDGDCARMKYEIGGASPTHTELGPGNTLEQRYAIAVGPPAGAQHPALDGTPAEKIDAHCPPADTYRAGCTFRQPDPIEEFGHWGFEIELSYQES